MRPRFEFIRHDPGEKYRPSNGSEGEAFDSMHCNFCRKDHEYRQTGENSCDILARTMAFTLDEPEYPTEWIYGDDGQPVCTAFEDVDKEPIDPRQIDLFGGNK